MTSDQIEEFTIRAVAAADAALVHPSGIIAKLDHGGLLWLASAGSQAMAEIKKRAERGDLKACPGTPLAEAHRNS